MSSEFIYEELDLESPSFRLIRLCRGGGSPIECELLHAYVGHDEDRMEYEAVSYTWGDLATPYTIRVDGQEVHITQNLSEVLEHLRLTDEDRFLWIDALCINQEDAKERGHQVRQMASIYERARQVIFWLGTATVSTDRAFEHLKRFEKVTLNYSCNEWRPSDERWQFIWSTVDIQIHRNPGADTAMLLADFETIFNRQWFDRIWIIQEVAKARSARVVCGAKSASARIFALIPSVLSGLQTPRCQAVLDIMPGPSRKSSWWLKDRDLETLLRRFIGSKATDPRDMVYALLGISSDSEGLFPDYTKSWIQVTNSTMAFLLSLESVGISSTSLPPLPLSVYLEEFPKFCDLREEIIVDAFNNQRHSKLWSLANGIDVESYREPSKGESLSPWRWRTSQTAEGINFVERRWKTSQTAEDVAQTLRSPGDTGWELLLDTDQADIDYLNGLSRQGRIQTPLLWAADRGREDIVELFLASGMVDFGAWKAGSIGLLTTALELDYKGALRLLPKQKIINLETRNRSGQTLLHWAVAENYMPTVRTLLESGRVDINARDAWGRTPLGVAARSTNTPLIELLLVTPDVDVNTRDMLGQTPLEAAVAKENMDTVEMLLKLDQVDVNISTITGQTPLAIAVGRRCSALVRLLLESRKCDVNKQDRRGFTPLGIAVREGGTSVAQLLLDTCDVDPNLPKVDWTSLVAVDGSVQPLILAVRSGNIAMIKMLLESGKMEPDCLDMPILRSLSLVHKNGSEICALLESVVDESTTAHSDGPMQ